MTTPSVSDLAARLEELSGENVATCNQCGKCTAGCPMAVEMDLQPNQIMRLGQIGRWDRLVRSRAIWMCASCETCATRCPMKVSLAEVIDALRRMALEQGVANRATRVPQFHEAFLASVRRNGRAHELGLIGDYKLRTGRFADDMLLGMRMFLQGKLAILPDRIRDARDVARVLGPPKT